MPVPKKIYSGREFRSRIVSREVANQLALALNQQSLFAPSGFDFRPVATGNRFVVVASWGIDRGADLVAYIDAWVDGFLAGRSKYEMAEESYADAAERTAEYHNWPSAAPVPVLPDGFVDNDHDGLG